MNDRMRCQPAGRDCILGGWTIVVRLESNLGIGTKSGGLSLRTVITGGAGFIGSHLCERFLADGHEVICVDNLLTGSRRNIAPSARQPAFRFIEHNISEPIEIDGPVDNVLHFASPASPVDYLTHPIPTLKVGSLGTHNALGLAKAKDARFLLASTSEVYGDPEVHPQREDYWGNVNPIGPRGCYDEAKRFAEAITMAYHRYHGVKTRIVRIFNTYGPRMRLNDGRVLPNFMKQALRGEPITIYGRGRPDPQLLLRLRPGRGNRPAAQYRLLRARQSRQPGRDHRAAACRGDHRPGRGNQEQDRLRRPAPGRPQAAQARHHPRRKPAGLGAESRSRRGLKQALDYFRAVA